MKDKLYFNNKTSRTVFAFLLVFALIFIRYCYYGFEYFYQLDDYIQYHNYTAYGLTISELISKIGMLGARPLAGVLDITLWHWFYPVMIVGQMIISALYAASALIFKRVLSNHFGTGWIFIIIYALLPLGFEGTYWMSAATRIVVGLFFTSVSLFGFEKWCSEGRVRYAVLYTLMQLLAYSMYEQILVLSFTATIIFAALHFKTCRKRTYLAVFAPLAVLIYFIFTGYFIESSAVFSNRVAFILPLSEWYYDNILPSVLSQIKSVFLGGGIYTIFRGFIRGVIIITEDLNLYYIAAIIFFGTGMFFTVQKSEQPRTKYAPALISGLLLAVAPIVPFFIIDNPWLSMRGAVASFLGIALICDTLFCLVFRKLDSYRTVAASVAAVLVLVFCTASVSELHDYRQTTKNDTEFINLLANKLMHDRYADKELKIGLLNVDSSYLDEQNYFYHEHIHGVTESGWALTGALGATLGYYRSNVTPIAANPMHVRWNKELNSLSGFEILYLYKDGELIEINAIPDGDDRYTIISKSDGTDFGFTYEDGDSGYLVLY